MLLSQELPAAVRHRLDRYWRRTAAPFPGKGQCMIETIADYKGDAS